MNHRLFTVVVVLLLAGCNDDDCVECPPPNSSAQPTLANIWPHTDRTQWVYDIEFNQYDGPGLNNSALPMPSLEDSMLLYSRQ